MPVIYRPSTYKPGLSGETSPSGGRSGIGAAPPPPPGTYRAGTHRPALTAWYGINHGDYPGGPGAVLPPIPLEWIIAPYGNDEPDCPSANATLGTFAATALIPVLLLTIFGCRPIVSRLTRGILGTKGGSGIYYTWLFSLGITLAGNYFSTLVVTGTDGYEHLRRSTVFALYASRPSFTMTFMALLRILVFRGSTEGEKEYVYTDSYISSAIGDLSLQTIAAVFIGITWKRFPNEEIKEYIGGALVYMEIVPAVTLICLLAVVPIWHRDPRPRKVSQRFLYAGGAALCFTVVVTASWVYWTMFLSLPGSLWCPPKLYSQAAIWIVASTLAGFISA